MERRSCGFNCCEEAAANDGEHDRRLILLFIAVAEDEV